MSKDYVPYLVPVSCKGIVIEGGKVWLRHNERGEWELPGGKLDKGEQPDEAVVREMLEELGVRTEIGQIVGNHLYTIKLVNESRDIFVTTYVCNFLERVGDVEHIGEAGKAEFRQFAPQEIAELNMPEFYKIAIQKAF